MAVTVINSAHSPVKVLYVTYKVEHAGIVILEYMVVSATCRVPLTVKTTHVMHRMDHALHVNLDGKECTVKQVRVPSMSKMCTCE